jgi:ribosomal protein S18 acetylase RimI-like enzyme
MRTEVEWSLVDRASGLDRASATRLGNSPCYAGSKTSARVRPIASEDVGPLMRSLGPLVDSLYPNGARLLLRRLEDALEGYAVAHVVVPARTGLPIALAAEAFKGHGARKLSTFWVSPSWRRRGVGSLLISNRVRSWVMRDIACVHVTVRESRSSELLSLLAPWGFRKEALEFHRYGTTQNELVLHWRPNYLTASHSTTFFSLRRA